MTIASPTGPAHRRRVTASRADDPWRGQPLVGAERFWVPVVHVLPMFTSWLGPLVVLLTVGERSARVRENAKESLNAEITVWLAAGVAALLTFILIGYVLLGFIAIGAITSRLLAWGASLDGQTPRYRWAWRLIR